ncbi:MAG: T9SS type A sorting domain-containing protein, partial [Melioribacteraceae bacterium]|nr:T9SS type A sorting domain-containing protein [Melioribacteraceae bacterium]
MNFGKIHIRDKQKVSFRRGTASWTGLQFQFHSAPLTPVFFMVLLVLYWTFYPVIAFALKNNTIEKEIQHRDLQTQIMHCHSSPAPAPQQLVTIDVQYVDKKGKPMPDADVEYKRDNLLIASDVTDVNGYASLDVLMVGVDNPTEFEPKEPLSQNYPNPFGEQTNMDVFVEQEGTFRIFSMDGKLISSAELNQPGKYKITWGGMGLPDGMYIYNFTSGNQSISKKMISHGAGFSGLSVNYEGMQFVSLKESQVLTDSLSFAKPNTTFLQYAFDLQGDTTFVQIGNPGPDEFNPIPNTQGVIGDTLQWYIPTHVYNDETSNQYNPISPNTWVSNDTLYFEVTQVGTTPVQLKVIDLTDNSLETLVEFNVSTNNTAPFLITNIPDTTTDEDSQYIMDLTTYFGDDQGDDLTYFFHNMPFATVDSIIDDIAYLMPDANWYGNMTNIQVEASDGQYSVFSNDWDWTVLNVNDAPFQVSPISTQQCMSGDTAWIWIRPQHADDIDSPVLTYIANNLSGNATYITQGDSLGLIPNAGFSGTIPGIVVNVDDGQYNINLTPFNLDVVLSNNPPVQTNTIPDQFSDEDNVHWIYMLDYVNDPDNDPLFYTVASLDSASYWSSNDTLYFNPNLNFNGVEDDIAITVSDGIDQIVLNLFDWYIAAVNDAPFNSGTFSNYTVNEDETLAIPLRPSKFDDVDSPVLTYTPNNLVNATYNVSNDTMYISPVQDWNGVINGVNITASDGQYQVTGNSFTITVNPMPDLPQQIANIPTQNSDEDNTHVMNMLTYFYNPDGDQMNYVVINQQNSTYNTNLDNLSLIPNANWYGTETG